MEEKLVGDQSSLLKSEYRKVWGSRPLSSARMINQSGIGTVSKTDGPFGVEFDSSIFRQMKDKIITVAFVIGAVVIITLLEVFCKT